MIHMLYQVLFSRKKIKKITKFVLSYDIASGCDIKPYIRIDKPLVVYRFW